MLRGVQARPALPWAPRPPAPGPQASGEPDGPTGHRVCAEGGSRHLQPSSARTHYYYYYYCHCHYHHYCHSYSYTYTYTYTYAYAYA